MNKSLFIKVAGMLALIILMSLAVSYVNNVILERQRNQNQVKKDISRSSANAQTIIGPVLAIPYTEDYIERTEDYTEKGVKIQKEKAKSRESVAYFLPENLHVDGGFSNEYKKLGIYKALMYQLGGIVKGNFRLPENLNISPKYKDGVITIQPAYLGFGISDTRGINGKPTLNFDNKTYKFEQGSHINALGKGIHALLGHIESDVEQVLTFTFNLNLLGMERFSFTPLAETNTVELKSSWKHPNFNGSFLPINKTIGKKGFTAKWTVSSLSSSNQSTLINALANSKNKNIRQNLESLSVGFVDPINVYSQADRATKYGLLFIGLTFVGFFIFEILKQLRIHPAQYTLVGIAMAMFYLLLISFAEMIGFASAYLIASTSCVLLLGYYLSFVLKSKVHGLTFSAFLIALYGALYGILASEDNALIMGSLLVFGLLTTIMVMTRKVDWYALNPQK